MEFLRRVKVKIISERRDRHVYRLRTGATGKERLKVQEGLSEGQVCETGEVSEGLWERAWPQAATRVSEGVRGPARQGQVVWTRDLGGGRAGMVGGQLQGGASVMDSTAHSSPISPTGFT